MPKLLFLDLETTGLDTSTCEVIEVAYRVQSNEMTLDEISQRPIVFSSLFKPSLSIPPDVAGITNIDNDDVKDMLPFIGSDVWANLKAFADSGFIAVCHNTDFDLAVLATHGIKFQECICTLKLSKYLLPDLNNHKLGTLRAAFSINHTGEAHRADYDVAILIQVFYKIINQEITYCPDKQLSDHDLALVQAKMTEAENAFYSTWQFGKFKGQKISSSQSEYIGWVLNNIPNLYPKFKASLLNYK